MKLIMEKATVSVPFDVFENGKFRVWSRTEGEAESWPAEYVVECSEFMWPIVRRRDCTNKKLATTIRTVYKNTWLPAKQTTISMQYEEVCRAQPNFRVTVKELLDIYAGVQHCDMLTWKALSLISEDQPDLTQLDTWLLPSACPIH